jgi:hypothetical protein
MDLLQRKVRRVITAGVLAGSAFALGASPSVAADWFPGSLEDFLAKPVITSMDARIESYLTADFTATTWDSIEGQYFRREKYIHAGGVTRHSVTEGAKATVTYLSAKKRCTRTVKKAHPNTIAGDRTALWTCRARTGKDVDAADFASSFEPTRLMTAQPWLHVAERTTEYAASGSALHITSISGDNTLMWDFNYVVGVKGLFVRVAQFNGGSEIDEELLLSDLDVPELADMALLHRRVPIQPRGTTAYRRAAPHQLQSIPD